MVECRVSRFECGILSIGVVFVFSGLEGGVVRDSTVFCYCRCVYIVSDSYVQLVARVCNRKKLSLSLSLHTISLL